MTPTPHYYNQLPQELLDALHIGDTQPTTEFVVQMMEATLLNYIPTFVAIARLEEIMENTQVRHGSDIAKFLDDNLTKLYVLDERQQHE